MIRDKKMKIKIVNKLIIAFSIIILISASIGLFVSNRSIDENFDDYLKNKKHRKMQVAVSAISNNYEIDRGLRYTRDIELLAKSEGFFIEVLNNQGDTIYKSSDLYLKDTGDNLFNEQFKRSKDDIYKTFYKEKSYKLMKENESYGIINIGYYSIDNCDLTDLKMKDTIYTILIRTFIITLAAGILMSIILARNLSKPLKIMSKFTDDVREGNLKSNLELKTYTKEISDLSNSINYLVSTLDEQDLLRKKLTSDMAHEIRTPLTTLQNTMEAFMYDIWEPTPDRIESCYEETLRLSKLVEGLKSISKLENMNEELEITKINLSKEVSKLLELFKFQYDNKDIALSFSYSKVLYIKTDKDKLKQVLVNLLNNAYMYTEQGGEVKILLEEVDRGVNISVIDNGIGINEDELSFIFERFYRTDETRDRETGGTGIGLTISKALVKLIGGTIRVESIEGRGSRFIVFVPYSL